MDKLDSSCLQARMEEISNEYGLTFFSLSDPLLKDSFSTLESQLRSVPHYFKHLQNRSDSEFSVLSEILKRIPYFKVSNSDFSVFKIKDIELFLEKSNLSHLKNYLDDYFTERLVQGYKFSGSTIKSLYVQYPSKRYKDILGNEFLIEFALSRIPTQKRIEATFNETEKEKVVSKTISSLYKEFSLEIQKGPVLIEIAERWNLLFVEMFSTTTERMNANDN